MQAPEDHPNEQARQHTLEELNLTGPAFEDCFDRVTRLVQAYLDVPIAAFSVIDDQRQYFKSIQGLDVRETERSISFCGHAILGEDIFVVENAQEDARFADNPLVSGSPDIRFYAGIPIHAYNKLPVGTLCAIGQQPRKLSKRDEAVLSDLRDVLEESLLLRSLSVHDHLTGIYNRRYFDEMFQKEWRRAYRYLMPLSVLMVDVDHFKTYNDTYGHQKGDATLRTVGKLVGQRLRRGGDLAARYGGEEFVIVLPETRPDDAREVAEALRSQVEAADIEHAQSPQRRVTVSIGGVCAASKRAFASGPELLLNAADEALYAAKRGGRNRLEFDEHFDGA